MRQAVRLTLCLALPKGGAALRLAAIAVGAGEQDMPGATA